MTIDEIKELLQLFIDSGVAEMELQRGENRLRVRRAQVNMDVVAQAAPAVQVVPMMAAPLTPAPLPNNPSAPASYNASPTSGRTAEESGQVLVKSPIVGTYYEAASPDAPPFVRVGDAVEPGQVLCIIESMKLMNEIEAEVAGIVAAKLVENGRPVEYGEALFAIKPR